VCFKGISVPVISRFFGIVITMYWDDHNPAHFHAKYGEYEAVVEIKSGIVSGKFPPRVLGLIQEWRILNEEALIEDWELCRKQEMPKEIKPLE